MDAPRYADVPLELLREPENAHRLEIDPDELHRLADSMAANGLHQAAAARGPKEDGTYEIVWGHRRLLAARLLRWPHLHCRLYALDTDPEWARLDENNVRTDLSPLEEARQTKIVLEKCGSVSGTARYFRRSPGWVTARLELLEAPDDIQAAVHNGTITIGIGRALAAIDDDSYRQNLTEEAHRTGATAAVVEVWKQHYITEGPRLIANRATVAEIMANREAWKYYVPCGTCGDDTDFTQTRMLRMCPSCHQTVLALIDNFIAEHAPSETPS